jgi:acyl carrier protein
MTSRVEREALLRALLASAVGRAAEEIPDGAYLREDLGLDSLMVVELLAQLSDALDLGLDVRIARALGAHLTASTVAPFVHELLDVIDRLDEVVGALRREEAQTLADAAEVD